MLQCNCPKYFQLRAYSALAKPGLRNFADSSSPLRKGSGDLVSGVISKVTIAIISYKLITLLTKCPDPPSTLPSTALGD